MPVLRSLWRCRSGNVAMMFALAIIPLFGVVGAAVDYTRISRAQLRLADALDAALLSVGSQPEMTDKQAFAAVDAWMHAHLDTGWTGAWQLASLTQDGGKLTAVATTVVDMTLARLLGVDQVPVRVLSEAIRSLGKLELAMVLDNTGSMKGTKIATLKTAAGELVDSLAKTTKKPEDLRIALVPFSQTVNVGPGYEKASWLDAAGDSASAKSLFLGQTVNRLDLFKAVGAAWGGCVETLAMPYEIEAAAPDPAKPDTLYVPYFAPDEPGNKVSGGYNNSYLKDSPLKAVKDALAAQGLPADQPDFQLLQGDVQKYTGTPSSGTTGAFGYQYGPNSGCEIAPLLRLSTNTTAVQQAINAMIANGNTDIPIGLTWGWNVLAPSGPFGDGVAYGDDEWTKVVVLMTDGNNENQVGNLEDQSYYSGIGYIWQGRIGATSADKATRTKLRDGRLGEICAKMKAEGVVIYTVRVEVKNGSSDVLLKCATEPENFYDVDDVGDLVAVFADIGGKIQKLRLAM
ncbi:MAG: pilus assembly protein [Bauldia sp.]